jgi:hypothetical protein
VAVRSRKLCESSTGLRPIRRVDDAAHAMPTVRKLNVDWPPAERLPEHIRDALVAGDLHDRGEGPPLTPEQVEALMELTSWAFNGVPQDHPEFEARLAAWTAQLRERHAERAA